MFLPKPWCRDTIVDRRDEECIVKVAPRILKLVQFPFICSKDQHSSSNSLPKITKAKSLSFQSTFLGRSLHLCDRQCFSQCFLWCDVETSRLRPRVFHYSRVLEWPLSHIRLHADVCCMYSLSWFPIRLIILDSQSKVGSSVQGWKTFAADDAAALWHITPCPKSQLSRESVFGAPRCSRYFAHSRPKLGNSASMERLLAHCYGFDVAQQLVPCKFQVPEGKEAEMGSTTRPLPRIDLNHHILTFSLVC